MACSLATATVAAYADDACGEEGCYRVAWFDYAGTTSTTSDVADLTTASELSAVEVEVIAALVGRRQSLRIRGLELRYLVGKTATSEGEGSTKIDAIRHQIESIEEEIRYIDGDLAERLDAYGRRSGPWLVMLAGESCMNVWFVPLPPCDAPKEASLQSDDGHGWLGAGSVNATPIPGFEPPGVCAPLLLDFHCARLVVNDSVTINLDGQVMPFTFGQ